MRWFRRGLAGRQVQHDPDRQQVLLHDVRHRFGPQVPGRFPDQAEAIVRLLEGDDGLAVAVVTLREFTDSAHADLNTQVVDLHGRTGRWLAVDRGNYGPLWRAAGPALQWRLFALACGFHPYVQVAAAVTVLGAQARRSVKVTDPVPLLADVFEVLDLTLAGWEFGRVRVDPDTAALITLLISTARALRDAMADPPPLPPPVREWMRRNTTIEVYAPTQNQIVGALNPGREMREALLA